jgi:hypothetical protein
MRAGGPRGVPIRAAATPGVSGSIAVMPPQTRTTSTLAAALMIAFAARADAATVLAQSVEDLARASDAVLRGRVENVVCRRVGGRIVTDIAIARAELWRGSAPARLTIAVPGGEVDGIGQRVDGAPAFSAGEDVVVFVRDGGHGRYHVVGLAQGKYGVEGAVARARLEGLARVGAVPGAGERDASELPVGELRRRVEAVR